MKRFATAMLLSLAAASSVYAETLKGGYAACLSEDLFDQFISAAVKKDEKALQYILPAHLYHREPRLGGNSP